MDDQLNPSAVTHLLQHTLRSLCLHDNSPWVYAIYWRILPRNYPPPKWDLSGAYDRTRGNRRNWILAWEDGFCNFPVSACTKVMEDLSTASQCCKVKTLRPELFFKMSHEIYNYGEGLIGKVAADHSHKWVFKDPQDNHEITSFLLSWNNTAVSQPRTWEAQFQSGIKTIALIAVREGVIQLGAVNKVTEELSFIVQLRKKFSYLESIPGVFLQHPSSSFAASATMIDNCVDASMNWQHPRCSSSLPSFQLHNNYCEQARMTATPMNSLEALLSKLPPVSPTTLNSGCSQYHYNNEMPAMFMQAQRPQMSVLGLGRIAKVEITEEEFHGHEKGTPLVSSFGLVEFSKPSE